VKKYLLLCLLAVMGCAGAGKLATPSGKPEVTIHNTSAKQVIDAIAAWSPLKGFQVEKTTEYGITTKGTTEVPGFITSPTAPTTNNFTVIQKGENVTVYLIQFRTYPQDGFGHYSYDTDAAEKTTENNSQDAYESLQADLYDLKRFVETE
jgi:hypothetical protein